MLINGYCRYSSIKVRVYLITHPLFNVKKRSAGPLTENKLCEQQEQVRSTVEMRFNIDVVINI